MSLALASSISVRSLERVCPRKGCPWPRIFFVCLALSLASSLVSSTPPLCIAIFVNWHHSTFLYQSKQQMVLNAIRFFFSSLIANMATILINFQQKFALVRSF